ncbi:cell division protein FtsI (penicillin-binding protein 3) [Parabacteroides sp. PFB2-12]|uniref:penicillin-binding transpeptidase domain-containing protein n=1 Tax=unclassified Parabacteroides TaxID=2649774 RepID=UPI002474F907|nr:MULTISPECIES: penicillin-binding transpeptidase domain-containing protein [unclassified Parabacteroides]MDH6342184.1 cell division protein FtsI (penicillin-binding protein 3) [Parabacteroides sp. PM6-13]MDH6391132.1 cell division protein FtsI (penicillin-binding protein 3) [Parabacteroides sp. PFB2-12]
MSEEKELQEKTRQDNKIFVYYFLVVVLLLGVASAIVFCAFKTAFVEKDKWIAVGESQKRPDRLVLPGRGNIYSAEGKLMATSVPRYNLYIDFRADGFKPEVFQQSLDSLSYYLANKLKDKTAAGYKTHLQNGLKGKSRQFPICRQRVSYADLKEIKTYPFLRLNRNVSGFYTKEMVQREKPFGTLASRTIGDIYGELEATGVSKGKNGLELKYDSLLRGEAGLSSVRRVGGSWTNVTEIEPIDGMDVWTTIDIDIQDFTEKALVDKLKEIDAESGTAVVMEVATGEIKAITNMGRIREGVYGETKNHAVADETEPGSTFKVASIMVALEDGVCQPGDSVDTGNGLYMIAGQRMTDHNLNRGGYQTITVEKAIWVSSNIGVSKTILDGYADKPEKFVEGLYRIGMNADLDLEIPGSGKSKIRMPNVDRSNWSKTALPWMSIGYETQILPIQTLTFYNAIANGGKMMRPYFTREITNQGKVVEKFSPTVLIPSICSKKTLAIVQDMLLGVVENGTGTDVRSNMIRIAGKTGTAQIASGGVYRTAGHQVSFCGYFPADDPQYSCIVVIRQPRIGYPSGGTMSGVVVKNIAERIYAHQMSFDLRKIDRDSMAVMTPHVKGGDRKAVEQVLRRLDVKAETGEPETDWVVAVAEGEKEEVVLKDLAVSNGKVPRVIGMGAKDAIYLLEQAGLQVHLSGVGKVISQSIQPGQQAVRGQTVTLQLR